MPEISKMTSVLNIRKIPRAHGDQKKRDHESVEDSLDITLSMSHTSNPEGLSWSSSDGSTYYSDEDEVSLKQRKQTRPLGKVNSNRRKRRNCAKNFDGVYDVSKDLMMTSSKDSKKSLLENVDSFPEIEVATNSEELSAVGFLTTEDTAKVFCTKNIPFEVTTKKKLRKGISAISNSSMDDLDGMISCSGSDVAVRHHHDDNLKWTGSNTESGTIRSHCERAISNQSSIPTIDQHSIDHVSVTYQEPVSPLESASTWDDLSLNSDGSRNEDDKIEATREETTQALEPLPTLHIQSKVDKIKQIEQERYDLRIEERINQLKAKIKSIQNGKKQLDSVGDVSKDYSSTEGESYLSFSSLPQREEGGFTTANSAPLLSRYFSVEPKPQDGFVSFDGNNFDDLNEHNDSIDKPDSGSDVPVMVPEDEDEDVSDIEFHRTNADPQDIDIETGHLCSKMKVEDEKISSTVDRTKILLSQGKAKAVALYDQILPIVIQKRMEFHQKPMNEQVIIIAIGVLSTIFFILLFIMVAQ